MSQPVSPKSAPTHRQLRPIISVALIALVGAAFSQLRFTEKGDKPETPVVAIRPGAAESAGYVGPQACAECHWDRVNEFSLTKHFNSCREPKSGQMPIGFEVGRGRVPVRQPHLEFEMSATDNGFVQTTIPSMPGSPRTSSHIDLIYGSSPTDENYFTWQGNTLYQLPVAWMHKQQEWGTGLFDPDGARDFSRSVSIRCLECHNTWFDHVPGTPDQYDRNHPILGVTCERCHGPAREHVAFHKEHPQERTARSIVHPGQLSRDALIDVCAQCHSNAMKYRGPAFTFRPGQSLDASYKTISTRHPEDDHNGNQVKYLKQSKCFQNSSTMTCITCHNPHKATKPSTDHEVSSSSSCRNCHQPDECRERPRLPAAVQDNCVGCHMPLRDKIQVFYHTQKDAYAVPGFAYDHRIAVHPIATRQVLLDWYRSQPDEESRRTADLLTEELATHWVNEGDRFLQEYRHLAAIDALRQALRLKNSSETRQKLDDAIAARMAIDDGWFRAAREIREQRYSEARNTLEGVLKINPDLAKVHGKLGAVYAALGQKDLAIEHLETVTRLDPDDGYGETMLAWMAWLEGRYQDAIDHYQKADEIEPWQAKIHFQWGQALAKLQSWQPAEERLRQAMTIDPNHLDACLSLSQVMKAQNRLDEASRYASQAVTITRQQNPDVLLYLAQCQTDAGQLADARLTAAKAESLARTSRPELLLQIQVLIDDIRIREQKRK